MYIYILELYKKPSFRMYVNRLFCFLTNCSNNSGGRLVGMSHSLPSGMVRINTLIFYIQHTNRNQFQISLHVQ